MNNQFTSLNKGIRRNTASATDGELDYSMNIIPIDGELRTVPQAEPIGMELEEGDVLICVHHVAGGKHFIVKNNLDMAYYDLDGERHHMKSYDNDIDSVVVMGNVLVVRHPNGMDYALWKDGAYLCLDSGLPQIQMQFQLHNHFVQTLARGEDTGITLEQASAPETIDFSETVAPTPATMTFSGDHQFFLSVSLQNNTSYRLQLRKIEGKKKVGMVLFVTDDDGKESYCGYENGWNPYVTFNTSDYGNVVRIRCKILASDNYSFTYSAVLLKGGVAETDYVMANTEENFNAVMAVANKFIDRYSRQDNKFIYPFFVRYALRMYDGSMVCPSAPCLMVPNQGRTPQMWTVEPGGGGLCDTYTSANIAELTYKIVDKGKLEDWKDLISGVVIAVSPPIYSFNQGAEWSAKKQMIDMELMTWGDDHNYSVGYGAFDDGDGGFSSNWLFRHRNSVDPSQKVYGILLPQFDAKAMDALLTENSGFYVVKEMKLGELPVDGVWNSLDMDDRTLEGLEGRMRLDDNAMTLSQRWGRMTTVYNSRLVMGNLTEQRFKGYMPSVMNGYCGKIRDGVDDVVGVAWAKALIYGVENGEEYVLCARDMDVSNDSPFFWFAYPGLDAKKAVVWRCMTDNSFQRAEMTLKTHKSLTLSYWFDGFAELQWIDMGHEDDLNSRYVEELNMSDCHAEISTVNKLQQSEVNNPFLFEPRLTNKIADTDIIAMASATQGLSQGQFGEFPLYVFTTDGIWAMSVGDDGSFSTKQPVSRDVCTDAHSVVMTDNAVVFTTKQGLKILRGASVVNMSRLMDGAPADLSLLHDIMPDYNNLLVEEPSDFISLTSKSKIAYDYPSNLLHIYPDNMGAHYVYSLLSGEFALSDNYVKPLAVVNDYPDTILQTENGLVKYGGRKMENRSRGVILTRPFCFSDAKGLKKVRDMRILWKRLHLESSVRIAVLASNDRYKWWRMKSLNSHSYRWFRVALFADISDYEPIEALLFCFYSST